VYKLSLVFKFTSSVLLSTSGVEILLAIDKLNSDLIYVSLDEDFT